MATHYQVLHSVTAQEDDELTLEKGSTVVLLQVIDTAWYKCQLLGTSEVGIVPRNVLSTDPIQPTATTSPSSTQTSAPSAISASSLFFMAANVPPATADQS